MFDTGILILRVIVGLLFAAHGAQKLFGWFGGYGIKGTAGWLDSIGVKPGVLMAVLAGAGEIVGGLLLGLGLWMWVAAALIVIPMLIAIFKVHGKNGLWITAGGIEYNLVLIAVALAAAFTGAGAYSLDSLFFS